MCVLGVVLFTGKADAKQVQQSNAPTSGDRNGMNCGRMLASNFIATSTYALTEIDVWGYNGSATSTDEFTLSLHYVNAEHKPAGTPLFQQTKTDSNGSAHWVTFDVIPSVNIIKGLEYSIVLSSTDIHSPTCTPGGGTYFSWYVRNHDTWTSWSSDNSGLSWVQNSIEYVFITYSGTTQAHNLTITDPREDDEVLSPPSFIGTCDATYTPLVLTVTPEPCFWAQNSPSCTLSYQDYVISPISCIADVWNYSGLVLDPGRYEAKIIDNGNVSTTVGFFIMDTNGWTGNQGSDDWFHNTGQTMSCEPMVNWSCDLPLVGDFCNAGAYVVNNSACYIGNTVKLNLGYLTSTEPYAYGFQIYNSFNQSFTTSSTPTSSLTLEIPYNGSTTTITATSTFAILPQTEWDRLRSVIEWGIYITFIIFIYGLIV